MLARIGELATTTAREARSERPSIVARRTYRVDSPHVTIANSSGPNPLGTSAPPVEPAAKSGADPTAEAPVRRSKRLLRRLPGVIRFAIGTWLLLQPYRSLIRAAVMFVLMAVTGASTMIIVGDQLQPEAVPPNATSTAADQSTLGEGGPEAANLAPVTEPLTSPDASTSLVAPTAKGPTSATRQELLATQNNSIRVDASTQIEESDAALANSSPWSPPADAVGVPHVQTSDPPPAVARFEGTIQSVLPPR